MSDLNLLAIALDAIGDPILIHDKNFRVVRANRAAADRLGMHRVALKGRPLALLLSRNGLGWTQCPYCEDAAGKGTELDHWFGGFLLASTANFHDPADGSLATVHVLRDVTHSRRAEQKYRALFESVQEGVFISTPDGRFLDFNDAFLRITGYRTRDELLAVDIASTLFVDAAERAELKEKLAREGAVRDYEFRMRRANGEIRTLSESSIAVRDESGAITYQGFVLDVTERKQAEAGLLQRNEELRRLHEEARVAYQNLSRTQVQLLQSEKMAAVGQLISGVAHELNNPLTAILGYSQLLADEGEVSPRGAQYVERLYRQAQRTHRIVQNLLSFARQRPPERRPVAVEQVLDDTLGLREYDLRVNNIVVHREVQAGLPRILGDPHQLQQVFLNILNNAVDVILEHDRRGEIWVRAWAEDGNVRAEFTDSGPGVGEPSRVFDPFYTTKPVGKGTGLGLSICYGLVKEHGGEISVRNAAPRGACFLISLPALGPERAETPAAVPVARQGSLGRILLVDDEEAVLHLEQEILRGYGQSVQAVRSGQEALEHLMSHEVDAVVTDLKMPGEISGEDLYEWIARERPALARRVVFTVSDGHDEKVGALLQRSGCPHLQKPFLVQDFLCVLQRVLDCIPANQP